MTGAAAMARLSWLRLWRGRAVWLTALLLAVPPVVALGTSVRLADAGARWSAVADLSFRSLVLIAPVIHLAGALADEIEGKTYTYLWSRPIRREIILAGKVLAVTPLLAV